MHDHILLTGGADGCVRATPFGTMDSTVVHEGKAEINDVAGHPSQKKVRLLMLEEM